jgi:endo-1,4-beta-xylanase
MTRYPRRSFLLLAAGGLAACGSGASSSSASTPAVSPLPAPRVPGSELASLGAAFQARATPVYFGAAVTPAQLRDPQLAPFIAHQFRVLVAENAMKPEALSRGDGQYDFAEAEVIADFARRNGQRLRGHTLVWHQAVAPWMFREGSAEVSRATLIHRLERYIGDVVSHFKGRVHAWDVVNEAYVWGEPSSPADNNGMRLTDWRRIIGPEYIEIAFRAAAAADPGALLFYNDYETGDPRKVATIVALIRRLRAAGLRIDGIGHQMHSARQWPRVADMATAFDTIAAEGVQQQVTELDIALNDQLADTRVTAATPELLQAQAERYRELTQLALNKGATAILTWGVHDAQSWLNFWPVNRFEAPLLFDRKLQPKPAYEAVLAAARNPA